MKIVIEDLPHLEDATYVMQEIAEKIEQGYTSGIVGWSSCSWHTEED